MRRGEVWTASGGKDYAGKPCPAVIVQDDSFDATDSITICVFTTDPTEAPLLRLLVEPNERNGLRSPCQITTVPKAKLGNRIGRLDDEDMVRLNQAMVVRIMQSKSRLLQALAANGDVSAVPTQGLRRRATTDKDAQSAHAIVLP